MCPKRARPKPLQRKAGYKGVFDAGAPSTIAASFKTMSGSLRGWQGRGRSRLRPSRVAADVVGVLLDPLARVGMLDEVGRRVNTPGMTRPAGNGSSERLSPCRPFARRRNRGRAAMVNAVDDGHSGVRDGARVVPNTGGCACARRDVAHARSSLRVTACSRCRPPFGDVPFPGEIRTIDTTEKPLRIRSYSIFIDPARSGALDGQDGCWGMSARSRGRRRS